MHAVLLDFNGTMFFDTHFHMEAWSKIYHELHPEDKSPLASTKICGPCNDVILKNMAPWLTPAERQQYSEKKEALYREACRSDPASLHLVAGAEELLQGLQKRGIPFALASASVVVYDILLFQPVTDRKRVKVEINIRFYGSTRQRERDAALL